MESFTYVGSPARVIYGQGKIKDLDHEVEALGVSRCLVLSTPQQGQDAARLTAILKDKFIGSFEKATMHTPLHITEEALSFAKEKQADCVVSIGGGSTIGLGKAIAFRTGIPHICIPTTYAGSEMTPILGETVNGRKTTKSDPKIRPTVVIYDVDLTMSLRVGLSLTSGMNAIAHAVEAMYASDTNPILTLFATEGIKSLSTALPEIKKDPSSTPSRLKAQYGAWLCAICLGSAKMALHHKLCHTLGGTFNLPHAETHTVVLPHALSYNAPEIPQVMELLAKAFPDSNGNAIHGLNALIERLDLPRSLQRYGMKEEDIDTAVEIALSNPYPNPRPIDKMPLRELIRRCWAGEPAKLDL